VSPLRTVVAPLPGLSGLSGLSALVGGAQRVASWATASLGAAAPWNRLSRDGFSWDSGQSWIRDGRGSWIGVVIDNTGPQAVWAFSNDGGLTFSTSGAIDGGSLVRASLAYNPIDDSVYALWEGQNNTDGIFIRRYAITRSTPGDPATTIASIATTRDATLNLVLDSFTTTGAVSYHSPQLRYFNDGAWAHGAVLALWSVGQTGSTVNGGEVRASMRLLSNSAADNTAANWLAPAGAGTKTITQGPTATLNWSKLFATSSFATHIAGSGDPFVSSLRLPSGDLAVVHFDASLDAFRLAEFAWRGTPNFDWAGTVTRTTLLAHLGGADADAGYTDKQELVSQLSTTPSGGQLYVGLPQWAGDGSGGDRWVLVEVDFTNSRAVATAVVYQATKALSASTIFVTGAAYYDAAAGAVLTTYTDLSPKAAYSRTYNRTTPAAAAVALYSTTPVDIPTILPWRDANGKAVVVFRDFNSQSVAVPPATPTYTPPYQGFIARGVWS
jgi:hypothetical protein